jgi:hypothetical protein
MWNAGTSCLPLTQTLQGVPDRGGMETSAGDGSGVGDSLMTAVFGAWQCVGTGQGFQVPGMPHVPG